MAPSANILPIKVVDDNGIGNPQDCADGIGYVVAHQIDYPNLCVINISWATQTLYSDCPCNNVDFDTIVFADVINRASEAGITTFAGTGNNANCGAIGAPACVSSATSVTAVYDGSYGFVDYPDLCNDPAAQPHQATCFSNRWEHDSLGAPGYQITAGDTTASGTSRATAHCSGLAALMHEKGGCEDPLTPDELVELMYITGSSNPPASSWCPLPPYPTSINAFGAVFSVYVPTSFSCATPGDLNCDVFVDGHDFELIEDCMTGPGGSSQSGSCGCADCAEETRDTGDGDIDMADFAVFQQAFTGSPVGACCHIDGTCTEGTLQECSDGEGLYQGHTTDCATTDCPPPPWGACCDVYTGECTIMAEDDCVWADGVYQGDGTDCETTVCPVVRYDNTIDPLTTYISSPTGILADDATLDGSGGGYVSQYTIGLFAGYAGPFDATVSLHSGYPPEGGNLIQGTEFTYYNLPDNGSPVFMSPIVDPSVYIPHSVWIKVDLHGSTAAGWFRAEEAELGFTEDYYARYDPPWNLYWWQSNPWAGLWATITCDATRGGQSDGGDPEPMIVKPSEILIAPPGQRLPVPIFRAATVRKRSSPKSESPPDEHQPFPHGRGSDQSVSEPRGGSVTLELTSPVAGQVVEAGELIEWSVTATVSSGDNAGLALVSVDLSQDAGNPEMFDLPPATVVGVGMEGFQRPDGIDNPEQGGPGSAYGGTPVGTPGQYSLAQIGGSQNTFGVEGDEVGVDIDVNQGIGHVTQIIAQGSFYAPATEGTYMFTLENGLANVLDTDPPPSDHWPVTAASVSLGAPLTFTIGEITCTPGDVNEDGTIDGKDIQPFVQVFLDPGSASPWESCAVDVDENDVLDNDDVLAFIVAMVGVPNVACTPGNVNDDSVLDGKDIQPFIGVMFDPDSAMPQEFCAADCDDNDEVNIQDIPIFVDLLLGG